MLAEFEKFLESIDLKAYRNQYRPIKLVEMDLPKEIQAIALLYTVYWDERKFLNFDDFYSLYYLSKQDEIEAFREKVTMCSDCFGRGLPARIYRTWASIITQIHAGYVAETVFGNGSVSMSEDLDHKGADFQVVYKDNILNYQVKKTSFSREVRQAKETKFPLEGKFIDIKYDVPSEDYFVNPYKRNGEYKTPYLRFIGNKQLKRLTNGFVLFTEEPFIEEKKIIDNLTIEASLPA